MPRDNSHGVHGGWQFDWRRSWDEVWEPAFVDRWDLLRRESCFTQVFHRPALVRAWAETCGLAAGTEPMIGMASHPDGATVLMPWAVSSAAGRMVRRRVLGYAGGDLFGYHDPMCTTDPAAVDWDGFWDAARASIANSCDQALFRFVHGELAPRDAEPCGDESPVLQLNAFDSFESLMGACPISHRGDVRRQRRRLSERGRVGLWMAAPEDGERARRDWQANGEPAYRQVWDRRSQRNSAWRPGYDEFIGRVISSGLAEGWGHYSVLTVDDEPIAWHVGLADRGRLYWCVPAHSAAWEPYSPGKVLLATVIEALFAAGGWSALDFQTGGHAYKMAWRPAMADLRVVRWQAPGLRGTVLSWYDTLRRGA